MNRSNKLKIKKGFSTIFALVFLFVASLLAIAINFFARSETAQSYHALYNEISFQTGESALESAYKHYTKKLNDPEDKLYKLLLNSSKSEIFLPDFTTDDYKPLARLADDYPGLSVYVTGSLKNLHAVYSNVNDKYEKKGDFELTAFVKYREVSKKLITTRGFKYVNVIPTLVSRFNLFHKKAGSKNFNNLFSTKSGMTNNGTPFVLVNGTDEDIKKYGWIYLEGDKIFLNLARGSNNFGEDFHLPKEITRSIFFPNQNYALLHINTGFYQSVEKETPYKIFPKKNSFKTSCLRLFGCNSVNSGKASPTVVIGDVWRRYIQAAAIGSLKTNTLANVVSMPWVFKKDQIPEELKMIPFLYNSFKLYRTYMSQIREEPYNRSFDYILSASKTPTPLIIKSAFKKLFGKVYPLVDPNVKIWNYRNEIYYDGKLKYYSPYAGVKDKRTIEFDSLDEFMDLQELETGEKGIIKLNGIYSFKGKKFNFKKYGPITVRGKGMMILPGTTNIGNITLENKDKNMISILVQKGDTYVSGSKIGSGIICEKGNLKLSGKPSIKGILSVDEFTPEEMRKGGILEYDQRYNPECKTYENFYAFESSPGFVSFREE